MISAYSYLLGTLIALGALSLSGPDSRESFVARLTLWAVVAAGFLCSIVYLLCRLSSAGL